MKRASVLRRSIPVLACFALSGCYASLPEMSSGRTGCSPNEIGISDEQDSLGGGVSWRATCRGKTYACSGQRKGAHAEQVVCTPMGGEPRAASRPVSPRVERETGKDGKVVLTVASIENRTGITVAYAPTKDATTAALAIDVPAYAVGESGCELRLLIDGQAQPAMKLESARIALPRKTRLVSKVPRALLDRLVRPHRVIGRVCEEEFRLGGPVQGAIEELLRQAKDELGWAQPAPAATRAEPAAADTQEP